jgi:hypothetical protein
MRQSAHTAGDLLERLSLNHAGDESICLGADDDVTGLRPAYEALGDLDSVADDEWLGTRPSIDYDFPCIDRKLQVYVDRELAAHLLRERLEFRA